MTRTATVSLLVALALAAPWSGAPAEAASVTLVEPGTGREFVVEPGDGVLHLVFFATWCPTCVEELTRLEELEARWADRGYRLIVVAVRTRQTVDRLAAFAEDRRPPGRLLFDVNGDAEREWKIERLPTHLLLDDSGHEVARARALGAEIEDAIADLLAERRGGGSRR